MAYGVSTNYILQGHQVVSKESDKSSTRRHIAIDPNQNTQWNAIGLYSVMRAGLHRMLKVIEEPSYLALPRLVQAGEKFELILIDGMHTFDHTLLDFFYADLLLSPSGVMIFDDKQMAAVGKVIDFVLKNRSYRLVEPKNLITDSFAILVKVEDDNREWNFHVAF